MLRAEPVTVICILISARSFRGSGEEIDRRVIKTMRLKIILHFAQYHATMGGIFKSKGEC